MTRSFVSVLEVWNCSAHDSGRGEALLPAISTPPHSDLLLPHEDSSNAGNDEDRGQEI